MTSELKNYDYNIKSHLDCLTDSPTNKTVKNQTSNPCGL